MAIKKIAEEMSLDSIEQLRADLAQERAKSAMLDELLELKLQEMSMLNNELTSLNDRLEEAVSERTIELQKTVLKLQDMSKAKSQFVANISHELRTPLNGILGFAKILNSDVANPNLTQTERESYLKQIERGGLRLLTHVERIFDFTQLEDGKFKISEADYHLDSIMNEVREQFQPIAEKKGLRLFITVNPITPNNWYGDQKSLSKIADVIIENAIKYTEVGDVKVHVSHEAHPIKSYNVLTINVIDCGPGLNEEQIAAVFAPFSQSDNSDQRKHGGLGLGLSVASRLAKELGAEIRIQSKLGEGSDFQIWYPDVTSTFSGSDLAKVVEAEDPKIVVKANAEKIKILAVDDDDGNLLLMRASLAKLGVKCQIAKNGQEAVEQVNQDSNINVILMDCQMPVMDGLEATRILRAQDSRAVIIAVTANATQENMETCVEAGMNGFISKPFTPDKLAAAIYDCLWFIDDAQF